MNCTLVLLNFLRLICAIYKNRVVIQGHKKENVKFTCRNRVNVRWVCVCVESETKIEIDSERERESERKRD